MAQRVKTLASKPNVPWDPHDGRRELIPQICDLTSTYVPKHVCTHIQAHT